LLAAFIPFDLGEFNRLRQASPQDLAYDGCLRTTARCSNDGDRVLQLQRTTSDQLLDGLQQRNILTAMRIGGRISALRAFGRVGFIRGFWIALCVALGACGSKEASTRKLDPDMARLVAEKRAQTKEMAAAETNPVPAEVWTFFDLVGRNDWRRATNVFEHLRQESAQYYTPPPPQGFRALLQELFGRLRASRPPSAINDALWCPVHETLGVAESFHDWDGQLLHRFGRGIIDSIPTNSIYFGGTDPGRFVITALSQSHREGRPFYTLTQNALADGRYLDYLRQMYASKIYIPSTTDSQTVFSNYLSDAQQRMQSDQLKPGEDVKFVNGHVQVSGQVAVMEINGLLVKVIFDHNPDREFYIEESFPLGWMYPYLSPHGLIMKLNREPLPELADSVTRKDHEYWRHYVAELLGDWMTDETSVKEVCDFAERVYLRKDLGAFAGDRAFARNDMAQKSFSKLRSSIAGVYVWRNEHAATAKEKERMANEADYAFRQAVALCPYSPEAVFRYTSFLMSEKLPHEALLVAQTAQRVDPTNAQVAQLAQLLKSSQ
jgi:hypothetical protein